MRACMDCMCMWLHVETSMPGMEGPPEACTRRKLQTLHLPCRAVLSPNIGCCASCSALKDVGALVVTTRCDFSLLAGHDKRALEATLKVGGLKPEFNVRSMVNKK